MKRNLLSLIITILIFSVSCRKQREEERRNSQHPVPYVPVEMTIYPNDPLNFQIQSVGGWQYFNGGINGIIVYRKTQQEFVAIERSSSFLPDNPAARAVVQADNFTLRDTVSGSQWQIIDGTVTQGPAKWPLRIYGTVYDGNALRIRN
jgi:hypothetical protein